MFFFLTLLSSFSIEIAMIASNDLSVINIDQIIRHWTTNRNEPNFGYFYGFDFCLYFLVFFLSICSYTKRCTVVNSIITKCPIFMALCRTKVILVNNDLIVHSTCGNYDYFKIWWTPENSEIWKVIEKIISKSKSLLT